MRIEEIHVYGFGQLQDVSYRFRDGINVIEGLNEAGKTTLMAFIRGVLFGFESRRNPELRYEPEGGTFGGAVVLTDSQGRTYRVERIFRRKIAGDVTVQLPDGGEEGEAFLHRLLGNMNEKVFKNIFAFGLSELQRIDTLQEDEINQFIYTAGTGDGNTIRDVQKELSAMEQELFRPGGSKARINRKLQQIRESTQELNRLKQENEQYEQLVQQLEELDRSIEQEEARIESWRQDIAVLEKMLSHYDDYTQYIAVQDRLKTLPDIENFPEDGVHRLETFVRNIREWKAQIHDLEEQRDRVRELLDSADDVTPLLDNRVEIEDLRDRFNSFREHQEQAEQCLQNARREQERVKELCEKLGPGWTEEKLTSFDTSVVAKQAVRTFASELGELESARSLAEHEREVAQRNVERQAEQLEAWLNREAPRPVKNKEELDEEHRHWEQANDLTQQLASLDHHIAGLKERVKEYEETEAALSRANRHAHSSVWKWVSLSLTLLIPVFVWMWGQPVAAVVAFGVLALLTVREFVQKGENGSPVHGLKQKREAAQGELHRLQADADHKRETLHELCRKHGQADGDLRTWENELEEAKETLRQWEWWKEQRDEKERERAQAQTRFAEAEHKLEQVEAAYREKCEQWESWLKTRGLPSTHVSPEGDRPLSPELVLDVMREIEAAKDALRRTSDYRSEHARHEQFVKEYVRKLQSVLVQTNVEVTVADSEYQVRELSRLLEEAKEEANRHRQLRQKLEELEDDERKVAHRLHVEEEELSRLLQQGGAENEEMFRLRAEQYGERKRLEQEQKLITQALSRLGKELRHLEHAQGRGTDRSFSGQLSHETDDIQYVHKVMSQTSKGEMEDELLSLQEKLREGREREKALRDKRAALSVKIEQLASGTDLSEQNQRCQQLVTDLQEDAREWAVVALTRHILQRAMEVYEKEKQPGVLKKASSYLQEMTEGRYRRVLAPIGEQTLKVERRDGRRFEPAFLSRGTVEQLYLAMRFALVEEYASQVVLPLILDDIFVNFDPYRTRAAIRTLETIGEMRQVLFFTCHAHLSTLFEEERVTYERIALTAHVPQWQ